MLRIATAIAAAVLFASVGGPASASLIWQQTFAPDPSGQTNPDLGFGIGFPVHAPATETLLTVQGGTIADVGWSSLSDYTFYFWENDASTGNQWVLEQEIQAGGPPQYVETVDTKPTSSTYLIQTNSYFNCYGSDFHASGICGSVFQHGDGSLDGVLVNASQPFTLSLYAVPEPATWAMMILGFGLMGAALRVRTRIAAI